MKFVADTSIMSLKEIYNPQNEAINLGLGNPGLANIADVRIGGNVTIELGAPNQEEAKANVYLAHKKLLTNLFMKGYTFSVNTAQ